MEQQAGHYVFGSFALYPARRELRKRDIVITLDNDAHDVLLLLLQTNGEPISHQALVAILPGHSAARLAAALAEIRHALDESPGQPSVIRKLDDGSFQFIADAELIEGRSQELFEQPRPRPNALIYAGLLGGMLLLLGLAITLIPPI